MPCTQICFREPPWECIEVYLWGSPGFHSLAFTCIHLHSLTLTRIHLHSLANSLAFRPMKLKEMCVSIMLLPCMFELLNVVRELVCFTANQHWFLLCRQTPTRNVLPCSFSLKKGYSSYHHILFFFQGFCLSFLTQLDRSSHPSVKTLIKQHILGHVNATGLLNQPLPKPRDSGEYKQFEGYWVAVGGREPVVSSDYVLTASVKANLQDLARVVSGR